MSDSDDEHSVQEVEEPAAKQINLAAQLNCIPSGEDVPERGRLGGVGEDESAGTGPGWACNSRCVVKCLPPGADSFDTHARDW